MTAAGFRTRKVRVEQSIGDRLKRARTRRKISVATVEEETKIRAKFILALESDSWEQIPSEVYGRGYLERYAEYLKLPVEEMMNQYDRSRATYCWRFDADQVELAPTRQVAKSRFVVTPRLFVGVGVVTVVILFVAIVVSQLRGFTKAPFLTFVTPAQAREIGVSQLEVNADTFTVTGTTAANASVTVNNKPVIVQQDGSFKEDVAVQKGINAIIVAATNAAGNTTTETLSVTVK